MVYGLPGEGKHYGLWFVWEGNHHGLWFAWGG